MSLWTMSCVPLHYPCIVNCMVIGAEKVTELWWKNVQKYRTVSDKLEASATPNVSDKKDMVPGIDVRYGSWHRWVGSDW